MAAATLPVAAASHCRLAGRPRYHAIWPPSRAGHPEPSSATGRAGLYDDGPGPNRKGQPLLVDWQVASRQPGQPFTLEPYDAFLQRAGLQAGRLPNPGVNAPVQDLQAVLPEAVACMRQHMVQRQAAFACEMQGAYRARWQIWSAYRPSKFSSWNGALRSSWNTSDGASSSAAPGHQTRV